MYLSLLGQEQKKLFFSLAYDLVISDGHFSEEEQAIINSYSIEMGVGFEQAEVDQDIDKVIRNLNEICDLRAKRIIIFEAIGLAMSDSNYDAGEKKIIFNALNVFGIETSFESQCEKMINYYLELQKNLNELILR